MRIRKLFKLYIYSQIGLLQVPIVAKNTLEYYVSYVNRWVYADPVSDNVVNMEYNVVLVRYGEITLKSPYVRESMEKMLVNSIAYKLKRHSIDFLEIRKIPGRIFIRLDSAEKTVRASEIVSKVFGVVSTSPSIEINNDLSELRKNVVAYSSKILREGETFAIRVRRVKKYPITSKELEKILGTDVLNALKHLKLKVNLTAPSKTIYVEVRSRKAYIYHEIMKGIGGLPYGVEGKAIALISGGIDSPVAAWLIMKRGVKIIPLFFNLGKYTTLEARSKALNVIRKIRDWAPEAEFYFYEIPFEKALENIVKNIPVQYTCIFCKTIMFKVAERIANIENAKAIVTGESLGQVASQTLDNIYVISRGLGVPVLRPLIGFDKEEIVSLARSISTYDISAKSIVECKASPSSRGSYAVAHAKPEIIKKYWIEYRLDKVIDEITKLRIKINLS